VQLCGTAESYVRLQAARPAGGSLALDDFGVALLCSRFIVDDLQWHNGGLLQADSAACSRFIVDGLQTALQALAAPSRRICLVCCAAC
jgi:hypothetical protein